MSEILCSTGALIGRPNGRNYRLLKDLSGQLNCDGFEFMIYSAWYEEEEELVKTLQQMNLNIPVVHCDKFIGESISKGTAEELTEVYRKFEANCRIAGKLKARKIVLHLWNGLTSDKFFENNLKIYPYLAETAKKYGVDLLIENVVCNVQDPLKHWCQLAEQYPDVHFIFDTKMAAFHEQLDLLYTEEYAWLWKEGHIRHYHINDYAGGYMDWKSLRTLAIGKGHIDFERFFAYIREIGYDDTFTVESTAFRADGTIDLEMLNEQFAFIRKALSS